MVSLGQGKADIATPALCLDLRHFEKNLEKSTTVIRSRGKNLRHHVKCHHSVTIATRLLNAGGRGIACSKISQAELFAASGFREILITELPVGAEHIRRLAAICRSVDPIVKFDHYVQADAVSTECLRQDTTCRALVEVNVGLDQTGVRPGHDAIELARGIVRLPGLKLVGIIGNLGHTNATSSPEQKRQQIDAALGILTQMRERFLSNGLCCEIITSEGLGFFENVLESQVLTEVPFGSEVFGHPFNTLGLDADGIQPALTLLATVISRPAYHRAVIDAGRTSISAETAPLRVKNWPDAAISRHSTDQIVLELGYESRELRIGDKVELFVDNSELTTILHDQFLCFRNDHLEEIWPIEARGRLL